MRLAQLGFRSINFDLIYGLPRQSFSTFAATLDRVIGMRPDRLAVYGYAHMPRDIQSSATDFRRGSPRSDGSACLLQLAVEKLCAAGYVYIGMDHFALPTTVSPGRIRTALCTAVFKAIPLTRTATW